MAPRDNCLVAAALFVLAAAHPQQQLYQAPLAAPHTAHTATTTVVVDTSHALSRTNPTYASWNIDSSYNRGFFHIDFTNANLRAAARYGQLGLGQS